MSYADDMKKLRKYKLEKRKELNKKYPKGGKEFIKAVNNLRNLSVAKLKAMGVIPISTAAVKVKIEKPIKKPKIIKTSTKTEIKSPIVKKTKETKPTKKNTGSVALPKKRPSSIREKSVTEKKTKDVKMVTLKDGSKGTIAQRLAEIDKEKEIAKKQAKFDSPKESKKRSDYFGKLASSFKTKKVSKGGAIMKKKKTKY